MNSSVQQILNSFDLLPETDKNELAYAIILRTVKMGYPPLSDDVLVSNADVLLLELDQQESQNETL